MLVDAGTPYIDQSSTTLVLEIDKTEEHWLHAKSLNFSSLCTMYVTTLVASNWGHLDQSR